LAESPPVSAMPSPILIGSAARATRTPLPATASVPATATTRAQPSSLKIRSRFIGALSLWSSVLGLPSPRSYSVRLSDANRSPWECTPSARRANPAHVDEVLRLPPVDVVLGHAALGEVLPAIVLARGERAEQRIAADLLVAARGIDLVQLVPAAELGSDRVRQELHQLHALDRVDAAGAAQVQVEILAQIRVLEVPGVRVEVDEPAGDRLLDQVLDLHVGFWRQHLVRGRRLHGRHDAAAAPRVAALRHRVRQSPDHVAPRDDLTDVRLDPAERARPDHLRRLDHPAGDEDELDR